MPKTDPLPSILAAREQRVLLKKSLLLKGYPCVSLSLNVPGFPKSNPTVKAFFNLCLMDMKYFLKARLIEILDNDAIVITDDAGDYFLASCSSGTLGLPDVKQIFEDFEEGHALGRFIDVDLNDFQGETISSGKSKPCFFCHKKPAIECRRQNTHNHAQLRSFMFAGMTEYYNHQREAAISRFLASLALKAVLYEISLSPKPGLVDKFSNGSHSDMSYQTFLASSSAISGWFAEMVLAGLGFRGSDLTAALPVIRNIGLRMESAMYHSTQHINTQKGIIFLMGLSLFACGKLYSRGDDFDELQFRVIIRDICQDLVRKELGMNSRADKSHGEEVFGQYGFSGARGEAESGFRTVFEFGLPQLNAAADVDDDALFRCFLAMAANNDDTNILYRQGLEVLTKFKDLCTVALDNYNPMNYSIVADYCKSENISPGGSADLLAVAFFIWSVIHAEPGNEILPLIAQQ